MSDGRMLFERERQDMARIVRVIFERKNTNVAGGNFSFKTTDDQGKDYIIMTPTMMSEAYLGEISPAQVLVVEPRTRRIVDGVGHLTREINMHEAMYETNPAIKAVLHAHAPNAMFWATTGLPMPNLTEATAKVKEIPVMDFEPNCSEELAELTSDYVKTHDLELPHKALQILDTVEWNAEIAYKQTIFQALGITDGFYSKGEKIGRLEDLKHKTAIYNKSVITASGD